MSLAGCAALLERGDPDRFLVVMGASEPIRAQLLPIFAFNLEVARAPWVTAEPMIAEMRLQWWRDAVEEIAAGERPRAHEVVTPLAAIPKLDCKALIALIEARRWDIYRDAFADQAAFDAYLDATSSGLFWASAHCVGARSENEGAVRAVGWASGLARFFEAVPVLEASGRLPLVDGRRDAVRQLAMRGLAKLDEARQMSDLNRSAAVLRAAWLAGPILRQAAKAPERVSEGTLGLSEISKRARLLWRVALGRW